MHKASFYEPQKILMNALVRLADLVRKRFAVEIEYRDLDVAKKKDPELGQLHFPVFHFSRLVGHILVRDASRLNEQKQNELADLIELCIEGPMSLGDHVNTLSEVENRIKKQEQRSMLAENVFPLRRLQEEAEVKFHPKLLGFSLPCLIESAHSIEIKKMALELHELSGRYAFICLNDLTINSAAGLCSIGTATVFIPEVASLTPRKQQVLLEYLRLLGSEDYPHIIAGSTKSFAELQNLGTLDAQLLDLISTSHLVLDRPTAQYSDEHLVTFFLSNLVRPIEQEHLI